MGDIRKIQLQGDEAPYDIMPARVDATPTANSTNMVASGNIKTYVDTAEANAKADWFLRGPIIPTNTNFNTLTTPGHYYVDSNTSASTMTNIPVSYGGRLEITAIISDTSYLRQTYYANSDTGGLVCIRRKNSSASGWSDWVILATQEECGAIANLGAKNLNRATFTSNNNIYGIAFTVNVDGTVTATGTATASATLQSSTFTLKAGTYTFSCSENPQRDTTYDAYVYNVGTSSTIARDNPNDSPGTTFTLAQDATVRINLRIAKDYTANNLVFKPMIRDAAITDTTYQPPAPTNRELYEMVPELATTTIYGPGTIIPDGDDLNNDAYKVPGVYYRKSASTSEYIANAPVKTNYYKIIVEWIYPDYRLRQTFVSLNRSCAYYMRVYDSDGWQAWNLFKNSEQTLLGVFGVQDATMLSGSPNLNTFINPGVYISPTTTVTQNTTGGPPIDTPNAKIYKLTVSLLNSVRVIQEMIVYRVGTYEGTVEKWYRMEFSRGSDPAGSHWNEWHKEISDVDVYAQGTRIQGTSSVHADLNDYWIAGNYHILTATDASNTDNKPYDPDFDVASVRAHIMVYQFSGFIDSEARCFQVYVPARTSSSTGSNVMYIRYRYISSGEGKWTAWSAIAGNVLGPAPTLNMVSGEMRAAVEPNDDELQAASINSENEKTDNNETSKLEKGDALRNNNNEEITGDDNGMVQPI